MRLVMNYPALRHDIGPFEDLSVLTKFSLVQQVVRTCFCDCLIKMYRACNADQSKDNCFFVLLNCWTSSRSQKTYSHLFSVTSDTQVMKPTNCYKICPLVRIGLSITGSDINSKIFSSSLTVFSSSLCIAVKVICSQSIKSSS